MARTVLGIAHLGTDCLRNTDFTRAGSRQLRRDYFRDDKTSGGLLQFFVCKKSEHGRAFFNTLGRSDFEKSDWRYSDYCRNRDDCNARTGRADDSARFDYDGYSGQATARSETYTKTDSVLGNQ